MGSLARDVRTHLRMLNAVTKERLVVFGRDQDRFALIVHLYHAQDGNGP